MAEWSSRVQNALAALPRSPAGADAPEAAGLSGPEWTLLVYCFLSEPPFTLDELRLWLPYTSLALIEQWFKEILATLNVQRVTGGEFIVTDKGASLVKDWCRRGRGLLAQQHPLPEAALRKLAKALEQVVTAALEKPTAKTVRLSGSRRLAFEPLTSSMARIDQALTDLYHFRDDCHSAAWSAAGLDGPEAEVLTLLWRREVRDVHSLAALLGEPRGLDAEQVARTAQRLASKALVSIEGDQAEVTAAGRALREGIEAATDRHYMPPWTVLPPPQLQALGELLTQFTRTLSRDRQAESLSHSV